MPAARPAPRSVSMPVADSRAEAASYTLLRRLAPSMRHHLVVNLQPIGMIYEVMGRRLQAPEPDLAGVNESARKINGFARAALNSCLDVVTWLAPEEEMLATAAEGVRECLSLLATSLTFRGYTLRNEVPALAGEVRRCAMRNVLTASIIHATDENAPPAELLLSAQASPAALLMSLALRQTQGDEGFSPEACYRRLEWTDVEALAAAENVELKRDGNRVELAIPWATA
ncbi:MAG: hypothetical protein H0X13_01190 [Ramlibacter sp.]|nr:hypothetical protein [Ramlibacter sp.]